MEQAVENQLKTQLHKIINSFFDYNPISKFNRQDQIVLRRLRIEHTTLIHQNILSKGAKPFVKIAFAH